VFAFQFFPKTEKYVPLYCGGDNAELVEKRNKLRVQIKAKLMASAASGKDLEGISCPNPWCLNFQFIFLFWPGPAPWNLKAYGMKEIII